MGQYVVVGEVTTLEHEFGDDTVEAGILVAEAVDAAAELTEVPCGPGDVTLEEVEIDAALLT